jgi:predicted phosphodiesterase
MTSSLYDLQQRAADLKSKTNIDSITPEDTFGLQGDALEYMGGIEQNADALGIRKIYTTYAAMAADTAPIGTNSKALRFGQLAIVYDSNNLTQAESGNIYAFQLPGWILIGNINDLPNVLNTVRYAKNNEDSLVPKGKLVYISGSTGENPLFKLSSNTDYNIASRTWGMTYENINSNAVGRVIHFGLIDNIDTSAYTAGTELWLGTNGEFTNVRPTLPTAQIYIGMVIRSSATVGSIFIDLRTVVDASIQDVYKKSNYNDGNEVIDFNTIHLIDNSPEYLALWVDKFNRVFLGIKTDGQPYFGVGCPQQVKDYTDKQINKILGTDDITTTIDSLKEIEAFLKDFTNSNTLKQLLDSKAEKTELSKEIERATNSEESLKNNLDDAYKKSNPSDNDGNVVDTNTIVSIDDDPEYIGILKDSADKLIEAIGLDGIRKFFAGIDIQGVKMSVEDNSPYTFLLLDKKGRIGLGVTKEGKLISFTLNELEKSLKDYIDNKTFDYDNTAINAANKADAVQSSLNSVNTSVAKNASDITKNTSDIANLKGLSGYDVANGINTRLTTAESDISNLKVQSGIGTDIISQNGGEDFIKQCLYGYKRILFNTITRPGSVSNGHADNSLVLFHFSDIHDDNTSASRIKVFIDKFKTIDGKTAIDDVVFTGDMVGLTYGASLNKNEWEDWGFENYLWGTGNHDIIPGDTSAMTFMDGGGWGRVPCLSIYNKYIAPYVASWGVIQPTDAANKGKNYYYKDYPELGYRLFMCDCFNYRVPYKEVDGTLTEIENTFDYKLNHYISSTDDMSTITDAQVGLIIYVGGTNSIWSGYVIDEVNNGVPTKWSTITFKDDAEYQSEQLDWLSTELNNAKTLGYHCIIGMHCTPSITSTVDRIGAFNTVGSEMVNGGNWVEQCRKIGDTCDTFVANGGVIACMLCGHTHRDEFNYHNNILCITISTASTTRDDSNDIRVYGERSQDALNLLALNKGKGILTIQRIGVNKDSFGQGKNFLAYDYINKKVKYQY